MPSRCTLPPRARRAAPSPGWRARAWAAAVCLALVTGVLAVPAASARAAQLPDLVTRLDTATRGHLTLTYRPGGAASATPIASVVAGTPEHPLTEPSTDDPGRIALAMGREAGALFGAPSSSTFAVVSSVADGDGHVVRLAQQFGDVPVLGAQLVVVVDATGRVLSVAGRVSTDAPPPAARDMIGSGTTAAAAREVARKATAGAEGVAESILGDDGAHPWIYDPALLGGASSGAPRPVWRTDVRDAQGDIAHMVLVDPATSAVVVDAPVVERAESRRVCDDANLPANPQACPVSGPTVARTEGQAATGNADVDGAYALSGVVWDWYHQVLGRDSIDGAGMALVSTVRWCETASVLDCPYQGAFWNGTQMVYGLGWAVADDITGHEFTHGYLERTAGLLPYGESGAIAESIADLFGELIDQSSTVSGADPAADQWKIGEQLPGGAIRSMADPTSFSMPDRMTSSRYSGSAADGHGVHVNAGVGDKAAYLIVAGTAAEAGGSFNGQVIAGIGAAKAAKVYDRAARTLLVPGSDYADLFVALPQACRDLIGTAGITANDCLDVSHAVTATEMDRAPLSPGGRLPAPLCPTGQVVTSTLFADDMENGDVQTGILPYWTTTVAANPPAAAWTVSAAASSSGTRSLHFPNVAESSEAEAHMASSVLLPSPGTNIYLRFDHSFDMEADDTSAFDGGVVEYNIGSGETWVDAGTLAGTVNGYTGQLALTTGSPPVSTGNPLAGRWAFSGASPGFEQTRIDLSSLAGHTVKIRFRVGTDDYTGRSGWFIDDVRIYTCAPPVVPTVPINVAAQPGNESAVISWAPPVDDGGMPVTKYQVTLYIGSTGFTPIETSGPVTSLVYDGLPNGDPYTFKVQAFNAVGWSPLSAASNSVTPSYSIPTQPANVTGVRGDQSVQVSWDAPDDDGGTPVTGYVVTPYLGAVAQTPVQTGSSATTFLVTGLSNGSAYTFRVAAKNVVGTGAPSLASPPVTPAGVPFAPTGVAGSTAHLAAVVSWLAPPDNGDAVTHYVVMPYIGAVAQTLQMVTTQTAATTATVNGLLDGVAYTFTVKAVNTVGTGPESSQSPPVVPDAFLPDAPISVIAVPGDQSATVSWHPPLFDGGAPVLHYTVTPYAGSTPLTPTVTSDSSTSVAVGGLTNGTNYTFQVVATNHMGDGAPSAASAPVKPAGVPGPPTSITGSASDRQVSLSWVAPVFDNGSPITAYEITPRRNGQALAPLVTPTAATSFAISGLVNGAVYTFTIASVNAKGTGAGSPLSASFTPLGPPAAPTAITGSRGDGTVSLQWTAPVDSGGRPITNYVITPYVAGLAQASIATPTSATAFGLSGLANGTQYTFRVAAVTSIGTGTESVDAVSLTPAGSPGAPQAVKTVAGSGSVVVSWAPPVYDGGSPVTSYVVTPFVDGIALPATTVDGSAVSVVVKGLDRHTTYTFGVTARNETGPGTPSERSEPLKPAKVGFTAAGPDRIFDTRPNESPNARRQVAKAKVVGDSTLEVKVTDIGGLVPASGVGAVSLNVAVTNAEGAGFVTVYPCGTRKLVASVNYAAGQTVANAVVAPVSSAGTVCFYSFAPVDLVVDLNGWFAADSDFTAVSPDRIFDTRPGQSPDARRQVTKVQVGGDQVLAVQVTDLAGLVPSNNVGAVSLNVAATGATSSGFVTVYPCGERKLVASVNYAAGQTVANAVIAPVSGAGTVCFYSLVPVDLIVDLNGWFAGGADFTTVGPDRLFDTRPGQSPDARVHVDTSKVGPDHELRVTLTGIGGLTPTTDLGAVSLNVAATGATSPGFVTVYPCGDRKLVASVNYGPGQTVANAVLAPVSAAGQVCFYAMSPVDLIVDINGWFPTTA